MVYQMCHFFVDVHLGNGWVAESNHSDGYAYDEG